MSKVTFKTSVESDFLYYVESDRGWFPRSKMAGEYFPAADYAALEQRLTEVEAEKKRLLDEKIKLIATKEVVFQPPPMPETELIGYLKDIIKTKNDTIARMYQQIAALQREKE